VWQYDLSEKHSKRRYPGRGVNEIKALLTKAERSLRSAEAELKAGNLDFAASRAYYGSFYIAEALLATEGYTYSSHGKMIAQYGLVFSQPEKLDRRFHRLLIDAFDLRQIGDYEALFEASPEEVLEVIQGGREFLEAASRYLDQLSGTVENGGGGEGGEG